MNKNSILETVRQNVLMDSECSEFDSDLIPLINHAFSTLRQIGVKVIKGFSLTSEKDEWSDAIDDKHERLLGDVQTYVSLSVKLIFDTPSSQSKIEVFKETIREAEWRIRFEAEN